MVFSGFKVNPPLWMTSKKNRKKVQMSKICDEEDKEWTPHSGKDRPKGDRVSQLEGDMLSYAWFYSLVKSPFRIFLVERFFEHPCFLPQS